MAKLRNTRPARIRAATRLLTLMKDEARPSEVARLADTKTLDQLMHALAAREQHVANVTACEARKKGR